MIKIITVGKIYKVDTTMDKMRAFIKSGEQFLKIGEDVDINRLAIMGYEVAKEAYWDGCLLDEKENYFVTSGGEKIYLSPREKQEIVYKRILSNKELSSGN